jgi:hypothetical protein
MTKVYDYAVIYNGKFYPAGTEIKVAEQKEVVSKEENTAEEKPKKRGAK